MTPDQYGAKKLIKLETPDIMKKNQYQNQLSWTVSWEYMISFYNPKKYQYRYTRRHEKKN